MQKTANVGEENLISLFIAGLQEPMKHELLTRRPATLEETFILAQRSAAKPATRPPWTGRDNRPQPLASHISPARLSAAAACTWATPRERASSSDI